MRKAYDTNGAGEYVGLSPRTLETKRVRGDGPVYVKLGRAVRYMQDDLDRYLEARKRTSTSDPGPEAD